MSLTSRFARPRFKKGLEWILLSAFSATIFFSPGAYAQDKEEDGIVVEDLGEVDEDAVEAAVEEFRKRHSDILQEQPDVNEVKEGVVYIPNLKAFIERHDQYKDRIVWEKEYRTSMRKILLGNLYDKYMSDGHFRAKIQKHVKNFVEDQFERYFQRGDVNNTKTVSKWDDYNRDGKISSLDREEYSKRQQRKQLRKQQYKNLRTPQHR